MLYTYNTYIVKEVVSFWGLDQLMVWCINEHTLELARIYNILFGFRHENHQQ